MLKDTETKMFLLSLMEMFLNMRFLISNYVMDSNIYWSTWHKILFFPESTAYDVSSNVGTYFHFFKIRLFSYEDLITDGLKSFLLWKFTSIGFCSSYIGETCIITLDFQERIWQSTKTDERSDVYKFWSTWYFESSW